MTNSNGDAPALDRDLINQYAGLAMQALSVSGRVSIGHATTGELLTASLNQLASQSFAIAEAMGRQEKANAPTTKC